MELKPAGKSGKVKAQIGETMLLSRYVAEARRAAKDAENSAQHAETVLINKQDKLVSGVNIKTINDQDVLGSGNIVISGNGSSIAIDSELSDTSVNAVQNRVITGAVREIERALNAPPPIGLGMTGATVGQVPVVKTVDANGVPTSYEPGAGGGGSGGLPAGGTDGDVLVKNGAEDYAARWTNTPKLMGSLATIEPTSSASKAYAAGDYLVYNGQLYKATGTISPDETLTPGGNISVPDGGGLNDVRTSLLNTAKGRADVLYALGSGTPFTSGSLTIPNISKYSVLSMVMTNGASLLAIVQNNAIVSGGVAGKFGTNDMLIFGINYALNGSTDTISITSDRRGYVDSTGSNYAGNTVGIRSVTGTIIK